MLPVEIQHALPSMRSAHMDVQRLRSGLVTASPCVCLRSQFHCDALEQFWVALTCLLVTKGPGELSCISPFSCAIPKLGTAIETKDWLKSAFPKWKLEPEIVLVLP